MTNIIGFEDNGSYVAVTNNNPLPITLSASTNASTDNSSTTPLSGSATFTGEGERTNDSDVMVSCHTDAAGTLFFDFSNDGTNWTTFPVNGFTVAAGIHEFHTAVKGPRWFRVRLINGSSAQTYLRLYTYFGAFRQPNAPLNQTIGSDADAIIVRTVDSGTDLAFNRFSGISEDAKFGRVRLVDAADCPVDIWAAADDDNAVKIAQKTFPTSAATLYLMSSSASDTAVDVTVSYIDANGEAAVAEDVTLTGQTPVSIGATGLDVNRILVSGATAPVGIVYAMNSNAQSGGVPTDTTDVLAVMPIGYNQSQLSHYTVPTNKRMRIKYVRIQASRANGSAGSAEVFLQVQPSGGVELVKRHCIFTTASPYDPAQTAGLIVEGGSHIRFEVSTVSDTDTNLTCIWNFELVDV